MNKQSNLSEKIEYSFSSIVLKMTEILLSEPVSTRELEIFVQEKMSRRKFATAIGPYPSDPKNCVNSMKISVGSIVDWCEEYIYSMSEK
mgnify:FL=1